MVFTQQEIIDYIEMEELMESPEVSTLLQSPMWEWCSEYRSLKLWQQLLEILKPKINEDIYSELWEILREFENLSDECTTLSPPAKFSELISHDLLNAAIQQLPQYIQEQSTIYQLQYEQ